MRVRPPPPALTRVQFVSHLQEGIGQRQPIPATPGSCLWAGVCLAFSIRGSWVSPASSRPPRGGATGPRRTLRFRDAGAADLFRGRCSDGSPVRHALGEPPKQVAIDRIRTRDEERGRVRRRERDIDSTVSHHNVEPRRASRKRHRGLLERGTPSRSARRHTADVAEAARSASISRPSDARDLEVFRHSHALPSLRGRPQRTWRLHLARDPIRLACRGLVEPVARSPAP